MSVYQTISRYFFALLFLFIVIGCELDDDDGLDTSILERKIEEAVSLFEDTEISDDGTNVLRDKYWVTQEDYDKFEEAIEKAITALNANAQIEIAKAVSDLHNAINNFIHKDTRKTGTRVTKDALENLIEKAEAAKVGVNISTNADYVLPEYYWATQGAFNSLNSAITYAKETILKAPDDADEDYFEEAYLYLETYLVSFEASVSLGADKTVSIATLEDMILKALSEIESVTPTDNPSELPEGIRYTDKDSYTAIEKAITTAQAAFDNNDTLTKKALDDAAFTLEQALASFSASVDTSKGSTSYILTINNISGYGDEYIWVYFYDTTPPENEEHINNYAYIGVSIAGIDSVVIDMKNRSNSESWAGTGLYYVLILAGSDNNNFDWTHKASYISYSEIDFTTVQDTTLYFSSTTFKKHSYNFTFDTVANIAADIITIVLDEYTTLDDWFEAVEDMSYEEWCEENDIRLFKDYTLEVAYSGEEPIMGKTIYARIPVEYLFGKFYEEDIEDED